ncbi:MAG: DUF1569 domain-containing protein [Gelidibacter sp.]
MKSLFDLDTYQEVLQRIEQLDENKQPLWGKMNVTQMIRHSQKPLEVANGKLALQKPNPFMRFIFKLVKSSLYDDKPWKHGLPTAKEFVVRDTEDFQTEKDRLIAALYEFEKKSTNLHWPEHPVFGKFTTEQWGKMQYKHLDHHLRQFRC